VIASIVVLGEGVVWYSGQFWALYFLQQIRKPDVLTPAIITGIALLIATPTLILFGWLSLLGPAPLILLVTGILGWIVTWPGSVFDPRRVRRGPGSLVMVLAAGAVMMAVLGHLFPAEGQYDEYPLTSAEKQSGPA